MAQKANLTPVDKQSDRRETERLDLEKQVRLEAGLTDVSASQAAPTAEHQHRQGPSFWQAIKTCLSRSGESTIREVRRAPIPVEGRDGTRPPHPIGPFRDHSGPGLMTLRRAG